MNVWSEVNHLRMKRTYKKRGDGQGASGITAAGNDRATFVTIIKNDNDRLLLRTVYLQFFAVTHNQSSSFSSSVRILRKLVSGKGTNAIGVTVA